MNSWRVGPLADEIWIVPLFGAVIPEEAEMLSPGEAAWRVSEWFPADGLRRRELAEIVDKAGRALVSRADVGAAHGREVLREAFRQGDLKAYRLPSPVSGGPAQKAPDEPVRRQAPTEQKTWVTIELLDDGDPRKPVPFEKYRIELPDLSVREGLLDANGQATFTGIDAGTCKVSCPRLHGEDWKRG